GLEESVLKENVRWLGWLLSPIPLSVLKENVRWLGWLLSPIPLSVFIPVGIFSFALIFPFAFPSFWPVTLFLLVFPVVYKVVKITVDESERYKVGGKFSLLPAELIFSHYPLKVGENDRLTFRRRLKNNSWTDLFKINKFPVNSHVKINLVCVERASYTKGTDRVTDVAVVYEKTIYSDNLLCGDLEVIAHFDLEIPLSCGSSFEGKYNKIRWILAMEESYPGLLEQKHSYFTFIVDS
ncbi:MAG: hypothetical protein ACRC6M_16125, partial [Microcystaceae cyanobacterium]